MVLVVALVVAGAGCRNSADDAVGGRVVEDPTEVPAVSGHRLPTSLPGHTSAATGTLSSAGEYEWRFGGQRVNVDASTGKVTASGMSSEATTTVSASLVPLSDGSFRRLQDSGSLQLADRVSWAKADYAVSRTLSGNLGDGLALDLRLNDASTSFSRCPVSCFSWGQPLVATRDGDRVVAVGAVPADSVIATTKRGSVRLLRDPVADLVFFVIGTPESDLDVTLNVMSKHGTTAKYVARIASYLND